MRKYAKWIKETFRYLICGISTVMINLISYHFLSTYVWGTLAANTAAFFISVLYAYITNSMFVFGVKCTWHSFRDFFGMRIGTILIDNGGLLLLVRLGINDMLAKCVVNVIIIGLNYIFSKFFIFKKK